MRTKFSFRNVNKKDVKLLFSWRNDPETRRWSFNKEPISLLEHRKYLKKNFSDKKSHMWIFLLNNKPCGLVRISISNRKTMLSYLIAPKYRGKKLSNTMLIKAKSKICKKIPKTTIYAHTLSKNILSIKSLLRAGFFKKASKANEEIFEYKCI